MTINLIEGKRLTAMSHGRLYQQRMKSAFDKKVRLRRFHEGDLVLKKMSHAVKDHRGKWAPNDEGPFVVKRAFSGGALVLTNMDGEELPSPVNSDVVKQHSCIRIRIRMYIVVVKQGQDHLGLPSGVKTKHERQEPIKVG